MAKVNKTDVLVKFLEFTSKLKEVFIIPPDLQQELDEIRIFINNEKPKE